MSKDETIVFRVDPDVKRELKEEADMFHMTLSEYMTHFINNRFDILPKHGE